MGKASWFGWLVCFLLDSSMTKPIGRVLAHLKVHKGWTHYDSCEKITIDQTLIIQQFGNYVERMIDATNALVKEAQVASKNIVGLDVFINKEQQSIIWMKEEYHTKFVTILQIIYRWERLAYFNNYFAITLNLANKGKIK
jgi:hypothetical protein